MSMDSLYPDYTVVRDKDLCTNCQICVEQCGLGVHTYDVKTKTMRADSTKCINCQQCVAFCPTLALRVVRSDNTYGLNGNWTSSAINEVIQQTSSGGMLLSSMDNPHSYPIYRDKILINASQVTNPSTDPLRKPMETRTFPDRKPSKMECDDQGRLKFEKVPPHLTLKIPTLFAGMNCDAVSYNVYESLTWAAEQLGAYYNVGEDGLHENLYRYDKNTIMQVTSRRFGAHKAYLDAGAAIEVKIDQGAKPGTSGHLPGCKMGNEVSKTRMIPEGGDAVSPASHHDIYSAEDLRQLVYLLEEAIAYTEPIIAKIAAVHNVAVIANGIAHSGADIIVIDEFRAGTGAAPTHIRDNMGIPIELAVAAVGGRLREERIRNSISLMVSDGIRNSADVLKAIALGADAVYITAPALITLDCHMCRSCQTDKYNWGITAQHPDLVKRLNPDERTRRLVNLVSAWQYEIMEVMGGMGINSIEALKGNRLMLREIGLSQKELDILGIEHAGEQQSILPKTDPDRSDHPLLKQYDENTILQEMLVVKINTTNNLNFRVLNEQIRNTEDKNVIIDNCLGQRFVSSDMGQRKLTISGILGNALGAYLNGADTEVSGSVQDATDDTMNNGSIMIHRNYGDATGYDMCDDEIYIKGNVGFRADIHMKAYRENSPVMMVGGKAGSFLGKYQAGDTITVPGLNEKERTPAGAQCCTGTHGGCIFLRCGSPPENLPTQIVPRKTTRYDLDHIDGYLRSFCEHFSVGKE